MGSGGEGRGKKNKRYEDKLGSEGEDRGKKEKKDMIFL
jgi:hypothetical protein